MKLDRLLLRADSAGEADRLRRRITELEASAGATYDLKNQVSHLVSENERLKAQVADTGRVHELSLHVSGLQDENRKLNSIATDRAGEVDTLKRRVAQAEAQPLCHPYDDRRHW